MKQAYLKFILIAVCLLAGRLVNAQTCTASFVYSVMPGGQVTFWSTSTPQNTITTQFYWNFGNNTTFTSTGNTMASTTYTANGNYTVSLFFLTPFTCSNVTSAVISITNATTPTCNINANFSFSYGSNGHVTFNNTSTGVNGGTQYVWNYGNSNTSTGVNGSQTYTANGTYFVTLLAVNSSTCTDSTTAAITVTNVCSLSAGFNYSVSGGNVSFFNTTTPSVSTTYTWVFGNNQLPSNAVNPTSTYSANGVYTVTLYANTQSPQCSSSITQTISITGSGTCNINANFTASHGGNGLVNFNNTSTGTNGGTTYSWNFGDSNTSSVQSPAHTYASNGSYVVTLVASNGGTCTSTKTLNVNVTSICNLSASFSYSLNSNGNVSFVSTSTGTMNGYFYTWSFGDNTTGGGSSTSHTYANGNYVVTLTVKNSSVVSTCSSTATQTITVTSNTCVANAHFSVVPTATAQFWHAIPSSPANVTNAVWSWGDGSFSNTLYTSHQYSAAGTYDLCLSVTVSCGANASYCASYNIYRTSSNMIFINVIDPATVGLSELTAQSISIYPNPAKEAFTILTSGTVKPGSDANLYNITGRLVRSQKMDAADTELFNVANLPEGVYFLRLETKNNGTIVEKVIVDK